MNLKDIQESIEAIKGIASDPETAHTMEAYVVCCIYLACC